LSPTEHIKNVRNSPLHTLLPSPCSVQHGATWRCWPASCRSDWLMPAAFGEHFCPSYLCFLLTCQLVLAALQEKSSASQPAKACNIPPPAGRSAAWTPQGRQGLHLTPSCGAEHPVFGANCRRPMASSLRCDPGCLHAR